MGDAAEKREQPEKLSERFQTDESPKTVFKKTELPISLGEGLQIEVSKKSIPRTPPRFYESTEFPADMKVAFRRGPQVSLMGVPSPANPDRLPAHLLEREVKIVLPPGRKTQEEPTAPIPARDEQAPPDAEAKATDDTSRAEENRVLLRIVARLQAENEKLKAR